MPTGQKCFLLYFVYDTEWNSCAYILAGSVVDVLYRFSKRMAQRNNIKNDFARTQPYWTSSFRFQRHENRKQQTERKRNIKNMFVQSCYV